MSLSVEGEEDKSLHLQNLVSERLIGCGFNEILNNSLTASAYYDELQSFKSENLVRLMNPLSNDLNVMRQTLLFGGMESIVRNTNRKNADLKFFEFGNCYSYDASKKNPDIALSPYNEKYHLGIWLTGKRISNSWIHKDEDTSVFELKAYVLNILSQAGVNFAAITFDKLESDIYSIANVIQTKGGKTLATYGVVSSKIQKKFDLDHEVYFADINWSELIRAIRQAKVEYKELSKYPEVRRDLALLINKDVPFAEIERIAYQAERKLLKKVELFDVYEGKNLEAGKKSYAVSFWLQDENATLNDKVIDKVMSKIVGSLQHQLDAKLR